LSDCHSIIPPTIERVKKFMAFTDRATDEEIAVLPPAKLRAFPLNIAANAVMAGCRPETMPLLVATVEAIGDEHYNLGNIHDSLGDRARAIRAYRRAVALDPDMADAQFNLGRACFESGAFAEAAEAFRRAAGLRPEWAEAWDGSGTVATLSHAAFARQTTYTTTITGAADLAGNPLSGAPYGWQFSTGGLEYIYLPVVVRGREA